MSTRGGGLPGGCLPHTHPQQPPLQTPTEAGGTHPTGMHSCFVGGHETTRQKCNAEKLRVAHNNVCA